MTHVKRLVGILFFLFVWVAVSRAQVGTQSGSDYELIPSPDLWYNSIDGVRIGGRLKGEVPGTLGDGPHRLNFGFWVGTKFPHTPVSYYISFTERIPSISEYDAEGNFEVVSSIRTGYNLHGIAFNKKWQPGFDDNVYQKLRIFLSFRKHFGGNYLLYPVLWNRHWLSLLSADYAYFNKDGIGPFMFDIRLNTGLPITGSYFEQLTGQFQQKWIIGSGFNLDSRFFGAISSLKTPLQMLYMRSQAPAQQWMESGISRARGTLPPSWFSRGLIQIEGGANLRGYSQADFSELDAGNPLLYKNFVSTSQELEYPNPIGRYFSKIPVAGNIIKMRSYLFGDLGNGNRAGGMLLCGGMLMCGRTVSEKWMADAGAGFSFSIKLPDNLGNMRTITVRYDVPLWLSTVPAGQPRWKYRSLLGFSAIFNL